MGILHFFLAQIHQWICCSFFQIPVSAIMALGSQCRGFSIRAHTERNLILFQRYLCDSRGVEMPTLTKEDTCGRCFVYL